MAIAAVSSTELNNDWMYAALRVQTAFNAAALAASPTPLAVVHALTPVVISGGEVSAIRVLRKAMSASLVTSTRPALTAPVISIIDLGWKYILPDLITKTNVSLAASGI